MPMIIILFSHWSWDFSYNVNQTSRMFSNAIQQAVCNTVNMYLHKNWKIRLLSDIVFCYLTVICTVMIAVLAVYVNTFFCRTIQKNDTFPLLAELLNYKISCQCDVTSLWNRVQWLSQFLRKWKSRHGNGCQHFLLFLWIHKTKK